MCREAEIKGNQMCLETLLTPHFRITTEHYSKLFQTSPYSVEIQFLSLTTFMMCKSRVEMKDVKFKQDWKIWSVVIGYSGGKKHVQHKIPNENLKMLIKNKSYSWKCSESDLRDVLWGNGKMESMKKLYNVKGMNLENKITNILEDTDN